jgi:hypothetical protein
MIGDTPRRTIRVDDELWDASQAKAKKNGNNLSAIVRDALRQYLEGSDNKVISDEAVEAAAKALWELDNDSSHPAYRAYEDCREGAKRHLRREARAVLRAAEPYLLAPVWLEGYREGELDGALQTNDHEPPDQRYPHRSQS